MTACQIYTIFFNEENTVRKESIPFLQIQVKKRIFYLFLFISIFSYYGWYFLVFIPLTL